MGKKITALMVEVKFKGEKPQGNVLRAKVANGIMGPKISFPHRHSAKISTGVEVEVQAGYKLCFGLAKNLAERGMVATNTPGNIRNGKIEVIILNCGREIVELKDGDPLVDVWLEFDHNLEWVEAK